MRRLGSRTVSRAAGQIADKGSGDAGGLFVGTIETFGAQQCGSGAEDELV